jgi:regulator of replication initiation timing
LPIYCAAQSGEPAKAETQPDLNATVRELQQQVKELREAVAEIRGEAQTYRAETNALREELHQVQRVTTTTAVVRTSESTGTVAGQDQSSTVQSQPDQAGSLEKRVSDLEEQSQLLEGKVNEQYQTKVESASKYRIRLSGIALLNVFSNRGAFDNQDFPSTVEPFRGGNPDGSFGATMRQSEFGVEVFGPRLAGAKTTAEAHFDLAGGFPLTPNGVTSGLVRLRTATLRMDWKDTSVVGGQDEAFFSPLSPTSFASLAVPAFNYAGNLWGWIPQVRIEHRFHVSENSSFNLQGGIVDNLTGDQPASEWGNIPQAGERSSQPAYATRIAYSRPLFGSPMTLGAAGYYSRQDWWYGKHVDGWAGMADWTVPLPHRFDLTGEFYRGYSIGGLGGGIGRSVVQSDQIFLPSTQVQGIASIGGWSQLKFRANEKLEFNGAYGIDNPYTEDLRAYPLVVYSADQSNSGIDPTLRQNRSSLVNFIYRPRSNLLFSAEYRHLRSYRLDAGSQSGEQINLIMGILF